MHFHTLKYYQFRAKQVIDVNFLYTILFEYN